MAMNEFSLSQLPNRYLILIIDLLGVNLLFYFSGHLWTSLGWIGVLPLLTTALYFDRNQLLIIALASAFSFGIQTFTSIPASFELIFVGATSLFNIAIGLLLISILGSPYHLLERFQREKTAKQPESSGDGLERVHATYHLLPGLNAALNFQNVLETTLELSIKSLEKSKNPTKGLVSSVLVHSGVNSNGKCLQIGSARRFSQTDKRAIISSTKGVVGRAIKSEKPLLTKKIQDDDELIKITAFRDCHSAYCVPLQNGLDTYGALLFAHPDGNYFTPERREILKMVASQARIALHNAKLHHDLELEKENLIKTQEESRKKLVRTLHDGPTQSVAALAMRANFARRLFERNDKSVAEELLKVEDLARRTTKEIRNILFTLKPPIIETEGLIAALQSLSEKMLETFGVNVNIEVNPEVLSHLDMNEQTTLLSMAEQAVNSARKNAKAKDIWVRLKSADANTILFEIEDNGIPIDEDGGTTSDLRHTRLSMTNLREKAELLNGEVSIQPAHGNGTLLQVSINISDLASDNQ